MPQRFLAPAFFPRVGHFVAVPIICAVIFMLSRVGHFVAPRGHKPTVFRKPRSPLGPPAVTVLLPSGGHLCRLSRVVTVLLPRVAWSLCCCPTRSLVLRCPTRSLCCCPPVGHLLPPNAVTVLLSHAVTVAAVPRSLCCCPRGHCAAVPSRSLCCCPTRSLCCCPRGHCAAVQPRRCAHACSVPNRAKYH